MRHTRGRQDWGFDMDKVIGFPGRGGLSKEEELRKYEFERKQQLLDALDEVRVAVERGEVKCLAAVTYDPNGEPEVWLSGAASTGELLGMGKILELQVVDWLSED